MIRENSAWKALFQFWTLCWIGCHKQTSPLLALSLAAPHALPWLMRCACSPSVHCSGVRLADELYPGTCDSLCGRAKHVISVCMCMSSVCLAQVVALLSTVEASKLQPELLDECLEHLTDLLQDPCYEARRHGATLIPSLYGNWSDVQVLSDLLLLLACLFCLYLPSSTSNVYFLKVPSKCFLQAKFDAFKPRLCLHSLTTTHGQKSEERRSEERMETSALFLGGYQQYSEGDSLLDFGILESCKKCLRL